MHIDVYQDTVCPWCRIGKRHLELALEEWEGPPVTVSYHPFFLNPSIPTEGYPFRSYMEAKGGGRISPEQFFARPRQAGEAVHLSFNFEAIETAPNTMLSHQLIAITPAAEREAMIEAIYKAYFEQGRDIGGLDTLVSIAGEQGMDEEAVQAALASGAGREAVLESVAQARQLGIAGVPFFVVDGRYAFSGAQPPHMIRGLLEQVVAEQESQPSPYPAGWPAPARRACQGAPGTLCKRFTPPRASPGRRECR